MVYFKLMIFSLAMLHFSRLKPDVWCKNFTESRMKKIIAQPGIANITSSHFLVKMEGLPILEGKNLGQFMHNHWAKYNE